MTERPLRQIDSPAAKELAETILIQTDIRFAISAIGIWQRMASEMKEGEDSTVICQALFRDAIVQFIGCFEEKPKHTLVRDQVYSENNGGHEYFKWLQDMRDAYAAHKFGALRQSSAGVVVEDGKAISHGFLQSIYLGPDVQGAPQLLHFMQIAADFVAVKIKTLEQRMLEEVRLMTAEQLEALPIIRMHGVDPVDVRKTRADLQRSKTGKPPVKHR